MKSPCVYILADKVRGSLYTGVTSDLKKRVYEHKEKVFDGFTSEHAIDKLVWFEGYETMELAIRREKVVKRWRRIRKYHVIEETNPGWEDLYDVI